MGNVYTDCPECGASVELDDEEDFAEYSDDADTEFDFARSYYCPLCGSGGLVTPEVPYSLLYTTRYAHHQMVKLSKVFQQFGDDYESLDDYIWNNLSDDMYDADDRFRIKHNVKHRIVKGLIENEF